MKNNYSLLCASAFVAGSGEANFNGVFTHIVAQKKPVIHREFYVVTNIGLEDKKKHHVKVSIKKPSGGDLVPPSETDIMTEKGPPDNAAGIILQFTNTKFEEEGLHEVIIEGDGKLLHSFCFDFKVNSSLPLKK